jgi:hypothetical protein
MKLKRLPLVLAGAAIVAGLAWAAGQYVNPVPENVLSHRIAGTWVLDVELTRKLDPARGSAAIKKLKFVDDVKVVENMREFISKRYANRDIFGAGWLWIDDATQQIPYIVTHANGNPQVIWFAPTTRDVFGDPVVKNLWVAPASERTNDMMMFGGDTMREAAAGFCRANL